MSEHGSGNESREPVLHAVLIGCDAYPADFSSLAGCVNDIDAVEALLLDPPGIGLPPERIRVTRLAAPRPGRPRALALRRPDPGPHPGHHRGHAPGARRPGGRGGPRGPRPRLLLRARRPAALDGVAGAARVPRPRGRPLPVGRGAERPRRRPHPAHPGRHRPAGLLQLQRGLPRPPGPAPARRRPAPDHRAGGPASGRQRPTPPDPALLALGGSDRSAAAPAEPGGPCCGASTRPTSPSPPASPTRRPARATWPGGGATASSPTA